MKNIISVDVGFGRIKAVSAQMQLEFPSVVGAWREIRFKSEMDSGAILKRLAVEYVGKKMFLGEIAYRQSKAGMNMSMERFCDMEGMALMLAAIALLLTGRETSCFLVAGLPVSAYAAWKEKYEQILLGRHYIRLLHPSGVSEERYINVAGCKVLPQPIGTVFNLVLGDKGELAERELASSNLAVLDIGANTLDLCRVDSLEFIDRESTSYSDLGVFECYRQLSLEIYNAFSIEIPPEEIEPHLAGGAIKIGGTYRSILDIKNKVYLDAAQRISSRVRNVWRNMWQFDQIIITGGGAQILGKQIARILNSPGKVEICAQGAFSNALGYRKFGCWTWSR